ncbi:MAG: hypothetical protein ABW076_09695 [Candidatus Thiodiazotropha sp.]
MKALLNAAVELCLLRRGPQDLPASPHLLVFTLVLNLLLGVLISLGLQEAFAIAIFATLFETALMMAVLYAVLRLRKHLKRFTQTITALMLSNLLLGVLMLPLLGWNGTSLSDESQLLLLLLSLWALAVFGHILRHALEVPLGMGIGLALFYTLFSWSLLEMFFPSMVV